jgi:dipeptidyl aminopeptidase/acylaminoacyl peptidase
VCYSNPRGSVGYGQKWSEDIQGRWGTVDMADLLAFFDAALAAEPRLDPARTGVMGGSYGGFMTNWITSQTGRFQAAVTDRSICNLISFGGTSDIGMRFWDDELGGNFHRSADVERLWAMSPLRYVEQVKTPTLIIHSLEDLRCPIEQGEQWFAALQLHGVASRFVRFPTENHELSRSGRPDRRARRLQEYLDWLGTYLKA